MSELITSNDLALPLAFTSVAPPLLPNSPLHKVFLKTFIVSLLAVAVEHDAVININMRSNFSLREVMVLVPVSIHVPTKLDCDSVHLV